jgi:hypothetical protein
MQCVANELSDEDAPVLGEVARCYRRLGDALVSGRGASTDQINALEDVCYNFRHETPVPRLPLARDVQILVSNTLLPDFSRKTVRVPPVDPLRGIRLHDLPECAVVLAQPAGLPATAGFSELNRVAKAENDASTSSVEPVKIVSLTPTPRVELTPPAAAEAWSGGGVSLPAVDPTAVKAAELPAARTNSQSPGSELDASKLNSESAVISALPAASGGSKKISRRPIARAEPKIAGYGVVASDPRTRTPARTAAASPPELESKTSTRSSGLGGSSSGYSAATPPPLPLTGPPLRPQTSGSVR